MPHRPPAPAAIRRAFRATAALFLLLVSGSVLGPAAARGAVMPDYGLLDENPTSPRYGQTVSPRDYQLQISAHYFGDSGCSYCRSQFGHLDTLAREIAGTNSALRIQIVGINVYSSSNLNQNIAVMQTRLPWLQDTRADAVWTRWQARYRDVIVVDAANRPLLLDNLSSHDLGVTANRVALRNALLAAAQAADSDNDQLPDEWERLRFGNLSAGASEDPDADGADNLTEFTFASDPNSAASVPLMTSLIARPAGQPTLAALFRRFGGSAARVVVETSPDLVHWSSLPTDLRQTSELDLHDGYGSVQVRWQLTPAAGAQPTGFIRARVAR